jgi:Flp pilus assembly protein CpaB
MMTNQQRKTLAVMFMVVIIGFVGFMLNRQMKQNKAKQEQAEKQRQEKIEEMKKTMPVVFATRDIEKRKTITKEDVKIVDVPEHDFPKLDYVSSVEEIVGQMALVDIYSREAILRARVAGKDKVTSLSFLIPRGMRALAIKINTVDACGGFLKQGDTVDILATFKINDPSRQGAKTTVSTDLLQGVKVLAIDKDYKIGEKEQEKEEEEEEDDQKKKATGSLKAKAKVSMVTVLLSPEDAEKLVVASATAKIKMVLPAQATAEPQARKQTVVTASDIQDAGKVHTTTRDDNNGTPEMVEVKVIRAGKKFQRFMPYEEAKTEAVVETVTDDDEWIEPVSWEDEDDLSGVSLPEF